MSVAAHRAVSEASSVAVRTARHPAVDDLRAQGVSIESFDHLYDTLPDFDAVYEAVASEVLKRACEPGFVYAVPGHPLVGERTVTLILERAAEHGIEVGIIPSQGFIEAVLESARASVDSDLMVLDALALTTDKLDARIPTLLYQTHSREVASEAKIALMERYPDEWEVTVLRDGVAAERRPLFEMDRAGFDHLTSVFIPPVPESIRRPVWDDLVRVISALRAPDGCPWDLEQTHDSLKKSLLEETYEVIEAIENDDPAKLEEELGDLMMQPVLHAVIAREDGYFTIDDSIEAITRKLIRRHPHVFGDLEVKDSAEVLRNWEAIKKAEPANAHRTSALDGVPAVLPALMRAMDISKKAVKVGFEWPSDEAVLEKVHEELNELLAEIRSGDTERAREEIGDLLFAIVNLARRLHIDAEEALRRMVDRFSARFRAMEAMAAEDERVLPDLSADEWDAYWERAKSAEAA